MSKNYQKAARGCLYALAVVIAGVCFSVKPAQSATCFLPSGNCSTGKIGGGPAPEATPEYCTGYNINQTQYNQNSKKYSNSSCFSCTSCTKTVDDKGTYYKCDKVSNSTWYDYDGGVCCTNGTKYDTKYKTCCASGDCTPTCPAGQFWSDLSNDCVCSGQAVKDKNDNCCASGQVLDDDGNCTTPCEMNACPDGYTYTTDPGNSEKCDLGCNKGYRYKCKDGYTYSNGKCEKNDEVITIYLTNIETEETINKTLTCNGHTESYGNILKESVHFSHDSNHNVNFKIYNKTRESNDRKFNKKTACSGLYDERITFNNGDTKVYAMYPNGNPEDYEIFGYYYNNYPTNYEVIVDGTTVASGSTIVSAREDVEYSLRNLHSLAGKVIEPSANNPYTIKFVYQEEEKCTPKDCSGYSLYVTGMNAEEDENLQTCDPGCGLALQYRCKAGYTFTANSGSRYCKKDTPDCDGITRFKNVIDMAKNMNKICPGGTIAHDDKCYYCGKSCAQLYAGAKSKCGENETATRVGQDEGGNSCYTCAVGCNKTLTSGEIANGSTVYYYGENMPYLAKGCPSKMTLNVACKYFTDGSQNHTGQKVYVLYINGAHNSEIQSDPNLIRGDVIEYSNSFMTCSGCGNTTCTFKYGGNKVSVSTVFERGGDYILAGGYYRIR